MTYINLIIEFFKTGLFAVGGGLATIPFLREIAAHYDWFTEAELINMIAIAESTPGPLGVNMATYAGYKAAGIFGGLIATLSLVLPSLIITLIITRFMKRFNRSNIREGIFMALRPAAVGLITGAAFSLLMLSITNPHLHKINIFAFFIFIGLTASCFVFEYLPKLKRVKPAPVVFIIIGAIMGIIFGEHL